MSVSREALDKLWSSHTWEPRSTEVKQLGKELAPKPEVRWRRTLPLTAKSQRSADHDFSAQSVREAKTSEAAAQAGPRPIRGA